MTDERLVRNANTFVLCDASLPPQEALAIFDADEWGGQTLAERTGRGAVRVLERGDETWVLRHYRRGGLVSRFVEDHYVWTGVERTRPIREWRLLRRLRALGLPVPAPVAARVERRGFVYRADLVTCLLPNTRPLSALIDEGRELDGHWPDIGRMVRRFHDHGVQHPDLTAHNILLDSAGRVFLVDFDNARLRRRPGSWREAGIARLERSLRKVALETGTHFDEAGWHALVAGYRGAA